MMQLHMWQWQVRSFVVMVAHRTIAACSRSCRGLRSQNRSFGPDAAVPRLWALGCRAFLQHNAVVEDQALHGSYAAPQLRSLTSSRAMQAGTAEAATLQLCIAAADELAVPASLNVHKGPELQRRKPFHALRFLEHANKTKAVFAAWVGTSLVCPRSASTLSPQSMQQRCYIARGGR